MNAEKISRPFAALPLHDSHAHGSPCISTPQQMRNFFSIHPSYTTGRNLQSYNQQLAVARAQCQ